MRGVEILHVGLRLDHQLAAGHAFVDDQLRTTLVDGLPIADWSRRQTSQSRQRVRPVLVVSGDTGGLLLDRAMSGEALAAGVVLLRVLAAEPSRATVLVPRAGSRDVVEFTAVHMVSVPPVGDVATAARALAESMTATAHELAVAGLAGFDPVGRSTEVDPWAGMGPLPLPSDPAAARLLDRALLVLATVNAALATEGPGRSASATRHRAEVLSILGAVARRAVEAAAAGLAGRPVR